MISFSYRTSRADFKFCAILLQGLHHKGPGSCPLKEILESAQIISINKPIDYDKYVKPQVKQRLKKFSTTGLGGVKGHFRFIARPSSLESITQTQYWLSCLDECFI